MVTEELYLRKKIVAASILYGCGYLLWQGAQIDAHCDCIKTP